MISREEANATLECFARHHGIEALGLDENDGATVEFGEEQALIFEYAESEKTLVQWSPICSLDVVESAGEETALLRYLLELNFPTARLGGAHVGIEKSIGVVLLAKPLELAPGDPDAIVGLCDEFGRQVLALTEEISSVDWTNPNGEILHLRDQSEEEAPQSIRI